MTSKRRKELVAVKRDGYIIFYEKGKKPPKTNPNFRIMEECSGVSLENGNLVTPRTPRKGVKKHVKKKIKRY